MIQLCILQVNPGGQSGIENAEKRRKATNPAPDPRKANRAKKTAGDLSHLPSWLMYMSTEVYFFFCLLWQAPLMAQPLQLHPQEDLPFFLSLTMDLTARNNRTATTLKTIMFPMLSVRNSIMASSFADDYIPFIFSLHCPGS